MGGTDSILEDYCSTQMTDVTVKCTIQFVGKNNLFLSHKKYLLLFISSKVVEIISHVVSFSNSMPEHTNDSNLSRAIYILYTKTMIIALQIR